jgi:hypothetical protein
MAAGPKRLNPEGLTAPPASAWGSSPGDLVVLVVEDTPRLSEAIRPVCDYLGLATEIIGPDVELPALMRDRRPVCVFTELETRDRDCCNVMQAAATYDRSLPILIVADCEDALLGVVDAVEDLLALSNVSKVKSVPSRGDIAEFLLKACRSQGQLGLMPI